MRVAALQFLHKTDNSQVGSCPALYAAPHEDGRAGYVVQGKMLDADVTQRLRDLGADESAVWVDADVLDRLRQP